MNNPETRSTLIVQLKSQRDEAAWWEFVRTYESFLQRLVERRGVPAMHVPDVTQQVLTAIARSIGAWQDDGQEASFRRWVNRVAQNVVSSIWLSNATRPGAKAVRKLCSCWPSSTNMS